VLDVRQIGFSAYADAYALQKQLVGERLRGERGDVLVLTEHEPVVTVGRGTPPEAWPATDLPVVEIERGGEATYHGPGQLVAYPILRLPEGRRDLHRYLRDLEEVVIRCLAEVEVEGVRRPGLTGVWIGDRKVCSIGIAAKGWVTWHGLALNLRADLGAFGAFRPCGLDPGVMTNLADHVELPPGSLLFQVLVVKHVCEVFDLELPPPPDVHSPPDGPGEGGHPLLPILPS
jgi:lipoate-protein ligase B